MSENTELFDRTELSDNTGLFSDTEVSGGDIDARVVLQVDTIAMILASPGIEPLS